MTFWVYKLTYDTGAAPHVRDGLLSLAICKPRIRAGATRGDVIFGFAGRSRAVNRGERLIYIAGVTDKLETPGEYYERAEYRDRWDCIYERRGGRLVWRPGSLFHRDGSSADTDLGPAPMYPRALVLISDDFRYMGAEGTMDYARRWPNLGTLVHERGIGELQVEPDSPTARVLSALRREIWRTRSADRHGAPTEPASGSPEWSTAPEPREAVVAPNRIGCASPRAPRGCAPQVPEVRSESSAPAKRTRC